MALSVGNRLRAIAGDARFALRLFRRRPLFTMSLLGVLAAGLGATTAMFSLILAVFVRPLPFVNADELTMVWTVQPGVRKSASSMPDFLDLKADASGFASLAAIDYDEVSLSSDGARPEALSGIHVTGDFFRVFAVEPFRGRFVGPEDDQAGGPKVAVISFDLWQRRFGADPSMVGRAITLNGEPHTVIGITPPGFLVAGLSSSRADVWTAFAPSRRDYAELVTESHRGSHFLSIVGRRKPGVGIPAVDLQLQEIGKRLAAAHPDNNTGVSFSAMDLRDALVGRARTSLWVLFGAVSFVFLIVCTNVANLLLVRASGRRAEFATRVAVGASPRRLAAQILTETVVLFAVGGVLGTLLARLFIDRLAQVLVPGPGALMIAVRIDAATFGFAVGLASLAGLIVGLVPAFQAARVAPQTNLKESEARASTSRSVKLVRGGLVVAQVSLAFTLLVGTGVALRGFSRLAATPLGLDPVNVATANLFLPEAKYGTDGKRSAAFYKELVVRASALPGVEAASVNSLLPMSGRMSQGSFVIEGKEPWRPGQHPFITQNIILPNYFRTMGIPLRRGRDFTDADTAESRRVMIISQEAAERFFPGEDPLGRRLAWGGGGSAGDQPAYCEIVGIAGDVYHHDASTPIPAESYVPFTQAPEVSGTLVVKARRPDLVLHELPGIVAALDPEQAISDKRLLEERIAYVLRSQRFTTNLLSIFAAAALALAAFGIFGLVSYTTSQRTREVGIRLALGSTPERAVLVVMKEGVVLLGLGLGLGLVGATLVGRAMVGQIAGAVAFDPTVVGVILGVLGLAGGLASLLPALRAIRISPAIALRYE